MFAIPKKVLLSPLKISYDKQIIKNHVSIVMNNLGQQKSTQSSAHPSEKKGHKPAYSRRET